MNVTVPWLAALAQSPAIVSLIVLPRTKKLAGNVSVPTADALNRLFAPVPVVVTLDLADQKAPDLNITSPFSNDPSVFCVESFHSVPFVDVDAWLDRVTPIVWTSRPLNVATPLTVGVPPMVVAVIVVKVPAAAVVPPIAGGDAKRFVNPVPETVPDAESDVNDPAAADVPPIAGGLANRFVNPVPETVPDALSDVNDPAAADVPPIAGGDANSAVNPAPDTVPDAANDVKAPLPGVVAPMDEAFSAVKVPAAAAVPPIAGGLANSAVMPAPETVELADRVVNAPAAGVTLPIAGGAENSPVTAVWGEIAVALHVVPSGIVTVPVNVGDPDMIALNSWLTGVWTVFDPVGFCGCHRGTSSLPESGSVADGNPAMVDERTLTQPSLNVTPRSVTNIAPLSPIHSTGAVSKSG
jgi:hypothetical protein